MTKSHANLLLRLAATGALAAGLAPLALAQAASPYQGVSRPPADDAIETTQDTVPTAKPSPSVPAAASSAPAYSNETAPRPAQSAENPDYGIVNSVPGSTRTADSYASKPPARLVTRPEDPDYGVVGMVPSPRNQLAEGTDVRVRLLDSLSTSTTQSGEPFRAQVAANVYKDGRIVIPIGSELRGHVVGVSQGHRLGRAATLRLRPESVLLPDGSAYHLYAQLVKTDARGTRTDSEGGVQPSSHLGRDMVEYGAGTGGGAVAGAMIGGPGGALAGALVGAGVVTTHLLLQHPRQASIEQGSEVTFSLSEPMDLVPTRN